eukprot:5643405-Pyramimonas_sp.AAC.1
MPSVSMLVYRADGCAVLSRAKSRCAMPRLELLEHIVAVPQLIDKETCQEDAPRTSQGTRQPTCQG